MTPATRRRLETLEAKAGANGSQGLRVLFQKPDMPQGELDALEAQEAALVTEGHQVMRVVFVRPSALPATLH